jgi:glutamyl-tRNA(Gln) amidotransferase subunit E
MNIDMFEDIIETIDISPTLVAVTLENTLVSLNRDGVHTENIPEKHILTIFERVACDDVSPEAIPNLLAFFAKNPEADFKGALSKLGLERVAEEEVSRYISALVEERSEFIEREGKGAIGGLMGVAMKELRGKADGKRVRELLMEEIEKRITSE